MAEIIQFNGKAVIPATAPEGEAAPDTSDMVAAWTCECGCQLYIVTPDGVMCSTCEKLTGYADIGD